MTDIPCIWVSLMLCKTCEKCIMIMKLRWKIYLSSQITWICYSIMDESITIRSSTCIHKTTRVTLLVLKNKKQLHFMLRCHCYSVIIFILSNNNTPPCTYMHRRPSSFQNLTKLSWSNLKKFQRWHYLKYFMLDSLNIWRVQMQKPLNAIWNFLL